MVGNRGEVEEGLAHINVLIFFGYGRFMAR